MQVTIEDLKAQLIRLTLDNQSPKTANCAYQQNHYKSHAEDFEDSDTDVEFYTGFSSWKLLMLF